MSLIPSTGIRNFPGKNKKRKTKNEMFKLFPKYIECCSKCPFSYERTSGFFEDTFCKLLDRTLPESTRDLEYVTSEICPLEDAEPTDE